MKHPPLIYTTGDGSTVGFSSKQIMALEEMATIYCCHTTGMHDPTHWVKGKYICGLQKMDAFVRMCKTLGINPVSISEPDCGWCRRAEERGEEIKGKGLRLFVEEVEEK